VIHNFRSFKASTLDSSVSNASLNPQLGNENIRGLECQRNTLPMNEASPGFLDHPGEAGWG
jgi:hypothetical protein